MPTTLLTLFISPLLASALPPEFLLANSAEPAHLAEIRAAALRYDQLNLQTEKRRIEIASCQAEQEQRAIHAEPTSRPTSQAHEPQLSFPCSDLLRIHTTISTQPEFLRAIYFMDSGLLPESGPRTMFNYLSSRLLDPQEMRNPQIALGVNLQYFLTDPEFQCRRPTVYQTLRTFLNGYQPFPEKNCRSTNLVMVTGNLLTEEGATLRELDLNRLHSIDYLFAGKGNSQLSQYGHAMLRLVFCHPSRKQISDECLQDISQHLVLSFRAGVLDTVINPLKGLKGDYPSSLYILPFTSVLHEYTNLELREITALPLRLKAQQKHSLLQNLLEMHWSYEGRYQFLSNNCAHETLNFLKRSLPELTHLQNLRLSRPDSLFHSLQQIGLGDASKIQDLKRAEQQGYFFPANLLSLQSALQFLAKHTLTKAQVAQFQSPLQYIQSDPQVRAASIKQLKTAGNTPRALYAAMYSLEEFAATTARKQLLAEFLQSQLKSKINRQTHQTPTILLNLQSGYGIPLQMELEQHLAKENLPDSLRQTEKNAQALSADYQNFLQSSRAQAYQQMQSNLKNLLLELSTIEHPAKGASL